MPRRARLALPNVPLHIIQRGNNRQACFYADELVSTEFSSRISGSATTAIVSCDPALGMAVELV